MKRILVGIDGSEFGQRAATFAADFAQRMGAELTLAHVVAPISHPPDVFGGGYAEFQHLSRKWAQDTLQEASEALARPNLKIAVQLLEGNPAEALAEVARSGNFDLVAVGSRGRGATARVLLGSVSTRLSHICPKPVLIVP